MRNILQLKQEIPGILLSSAIGIAAFLAAPFLPSALGSILLALLAGMMLGNFVNLPARFSSGIGFTSSKLLELSIIFLAFSIQYTHLSRLGAASFSIIAVTVLMMLLLTYFLAIRFNCPGSTGWLVGFGTTICGSSAIAALAPGVSKNKEDVAIAMAVVNLFGSIGMIAMPMLLADSGMTPAQMGVLLGGTLHSVGNVAGAGYALGNEAGEAAITIKLARVALLSPALIFFNYLVNRKQAGSNWKTYFKLPWYLWSFIGITILTSIIPIPAAFTDAMESGGKLILTIAMAAIGMKVSFAKLFQSGKKGLVFGLLLFLLQIALVYGLINLMMEGQKYACAG